MKNKKKWKIWASSLSLLSLISLTVPFVVSCSSTNIGKNYSHSDNPNKPKATLNVNNALDLSNVSQADNDGLTSLFTFSWNNTLNNSLNNISLSANNSEVTFKTNAKDGSTAMWYISNSDDGVVTNSVNIGQSTVQNGSSNISIPSVFLNKITQDQYSYYLFVIIDNTDMYYPIQSTTSTLNVSGNVSLNISDGWLKNANGISALCINNPLTLSVSGLNSDVTNASDVSYTWSILNHTGSVQTTLYTTSTDSYAYTPTSPGYLTLQCVITQNKTTINTITLNVYITNWADLSITNTNLVNNVMTITNTNQTLSTLISNSFIPTSATISYQWYQKLVDNTNSGTNLAFSAIGTNSDSFALTNLIPAYTYSYQVIITFAYNKIVHTINSNIVQVYYNNTVGTISISSNSTITNNTIYVKNGDSVTLTLNKSDVKVPISSYQWQIEQNGSWTNISNATSDTYTFTETNSTINPIRVVATPLQNWNAGSIYSNTITIQTPAISSALSTEIYNKAVAYFNDSTNLGNVFKSYFMNSSNSNYWWLWDSLLAGWWKGGGRFVVKSGSSYSNVTTNNVLTCFTLSSVSVINGSFNSAKPTGSPRLVFNFTVNTADVYISVNSSYINLPQNSSFSFSSPIYISNVSGESSGFSFSVASNGAVNYTISNSLGNQTDMKYYWNSTANSAWGLNFDSSILSELKNKAGFFKLQTTNDYTVLYNWLNAPSTIVLNTDTAPDMPNFYQEILNSNVKIIATPNITSSSTKPIGFTLGTLNLSVSASLSNSASTTFTYSWQKQKSGASTWTAISNTSNTLDLTYPTSGVSSAYIMIYQVTIKTTYNNQTYTTTCDFYVNYAPTSASTNTA